MIPDLSTRQREEEWMDAPDVQPEMIRRSLRFIRKVNRWFGYDRATLSHLKHFSRNWKPGQTITILDVATGSADIPRALVHWGSRRGFDIRPVGLDRHHLTASEALDLSRSEPAISIVRGDAMRLPFADGSFDYVMTNMFLHHLDENPVVEVLREMNRVARRGIIAADLIRDRRAYAWIALFTILSNPMVRHDARVSVAQAFTKEEMLGLCERANINYAQFFQHFAYRFVLTGEKTI